MRAWSFALRSLVRQPGRSALGVLGVAAIGALLLDMLLLSRGLVLSFRNLLDSAGFDVRVLAGDDLPLAAPRLTQATPAVAAIAALPEVDEVVPLRFGEASATGADGRPLKIHVTGVDPGRRRPWVLLEGRDLAAAGPGLPGLVVNRNLATALRLAPGAEAVLRVRCTANAADFLPARFRVAGIVEFPFDEATELTAATRLAAFRGACGLEDRDEADLLLVASRERHGAAAAVTAIRGLRPDLHAFSNAQLVARFEQVGFSYFRQISSVLSCVTLFFGFLLISVLLTVSVHQRLAEIAALRALGLSARRVSQDLLCQSVLLVGSGGALSVPLGLVLARWLDAILREMPQIPASVHFFVLEPRALAIHAGLLGTTALLAALYPMRLVARLPIAATLRNEVIS